MQNLQHNSCYLWNDNVFSTKFYVFTHLHLFEWKISFRCFLWNRMNGTFHIELKWNNEFICNIWLYTSSSLIVISMILKYIRPLHYHDNHNFFINIFFNHLISILKWFLLTILFYFVINTISNKKSFPY
jgi:hypothetical protein